MPSFGLAALAWRSLVARRLRSALTTLGIALGVGVLFASLATNAGIERSIDRTVRELVGRADLRVSAFQERGLSGATLAAIRATPGVEAAVPQVEQRIYLTRNEAAANAAEAPVTVVGIDPLLDPLVHDLSIIRGTTASTWAASSRFSARASPRRSASSGSSPATGRRPGPSGAP